MIVDTSALLAFFHPREAHHGQVSALFAETRESLIVSPYVLAELDYLILRRLGVRSEIEVLRAMLEPAWVIPHVTDAHLSRAADLVEAYAEHRVGVTDAVNVALAESYHTTKIATLDRRHFTILRLADSTLVEIVP
ncbi:MAG: PIN domain-containing protein [Bifidobacteriaceae bacterium]|jgi:predicted nucleic acid-binding protein|nr:PIN domain-containing protein [Bifidobacteriaceae bacterium]